MSKEYYTLREQIDNNGGLLNDESLHFIARHGLLCELLLCDNRLGEGGVLGVACDGICAKQQRACVLSLYARRPRLQNNVGTKPIGRCDVGVAVS